MDEEIIDLIYQNEEVEGIAIFSPSGEVIENQLALTEDSVAVVSKTVANINTALDSADRRLKGFLLKSEKVRMQICILDDVILLLQLSEEFSANDLEKKIRSIMSGVNIKTPSTPQLPPDPVPQEARAQFITSVEPQNDTHTTTLDPKIEENQIDFAEFKSKLTKLIKRVAPGGIAEKMINEAILSENIDSTTVFINKDAASALGEKVVAKIPNASRRKMIAKEYQILTKSL